MEIKGRLIHVLAVQSGEGKNGPWKKQDFVIETDGQYPKKVCLTIWGDKFNETFLTVGNELLVSFDAESREYNGRWFTDLKAWKIELAGSESAEKTQLQHLTEHLLLHNQLRLLQSLQFLLKATKTIYRFNLRLRSGNEKK